MRSATFSVLIFFDVLCVPILSSKSSLSHFWRVTLPLQVLYKAPRSSFCGCCGGLFYHHSFFKGQKPFSVTTRVHKVRTRYFVKKATETHCQCRKIGSQWSLWSVVWWLQRRQQRNWCQCYWSKKFINKKFSLQLKATQSSCSTET